MGPARRRSSERAALLGLVSGAATVGAVVLLVASVRAGAVLASLGTFLLADLLLAVSIGSFLAAAGRDDASRAATTTPGPELTTPRDRRPADSPSASAAPEDDPLTTRLAERRAQLLAITALAARRLTTLDLTAIPDHLVNAAVSLGSDCAGIVELDRATGRVRCTHEGGPRVHHSDLSAALASDPVAEVVRTGTQLPLDEAELRRRCGDLHARGFTAAAITPISVDGAVELVLVAASTRTSRLTPEELEALDLLALHAGASLANARWFEAERRALTGMEALAREQDDFLSTVSHELRTPLTMTRGAAELLQTRWAELGDEDRTRLLARLVANVDDLDGAVERVLSFGHLEGTPGELLRTWVPVEEVLAEVVERLGPRADGHHITTSVSPQGLAVDADRRLLTWMLDELADNAVRHTPEGTTVTLRCWVIGDRAVVEVRDDGPGLEPDELARVVRRFGRGGDVLRRPTRGLGLGLTVARRVARAHLADLQLHAEPGAGLQARVVLPARRPDTSRARLPASRVFRLRETGADAERS